MCTQLKGAARAPPPPPHRCGQTLLPHSTPPVALAPPTDGPQGRAGPWRTICPPTNQSINLPFNLTINRSPCRHRPIIAQESCARPPARPPARPHLAPEADCVADGLHGVGVAADEEAAEEDALDAEAHGVHVSLAGRGDGGEGSGPVRGGSGPQPKGPPRITCRYTGDLLVPRCAAAILGGGGCKAKGCGGYTAGPCPLPRPALERRLCPPPRRRLTSWPMLYATMRHSARHRSAGLYSPRVLCCAHQQHNTNNRGGGRRGGEAEARW